MSDGDTIKRLQYFNIIIYVSNVAVFALKIVDCSNHKVAGGENSTFIAKTFVPHLLKNDQLKSLLDVMFPNGDSNMVKF